MTGRETRFRTRSNHGRALAAVAVLLICLAPAKAAAQQVATPSRTSGTSTESKRQERKLVTILIERFRPAISEQNDERLDSNGATELEAALLRIARKRGDLELTFVSEGDRNAVEREKGRLQDKTIQRPDVAGYQYQIETTYSGLSPGRFYAQLLQVNPIQHTTVNATFDKKDPDPTAQLAWELLRELRHLLGRPSPDYNLHVPCFQIEGEGDVSNSPVVKWFRDAARTSVSDALKGLWLNLVVPSEESGCAQPSGGEAQEKGEIYLVGKIHVLTMVSSGGPPSGTTTLYFVSLEVVRGPLKEGEVLASVPAVACKALPDLPDMAEKQGEQLKSDLNSPAFQEKLETE